MPKSVSVQSTQETSSLKLKELQLDIKKDPANKITGAQELDLVLGLVTI